MKLRSGAGKFLEILLFYCFFLSTIGVISANAADMTFGHPASTYQLSNCFYNTLTCAKSTQYHTGIDYSKNGSHDIIASNNGTVAYVEYMSSNDHGMGNNLILEHILDGNIKIYSSYSHLASIEIGFAVGSKVTKGQKIGTMGASGHGQPDYWSTCPTCCGTSAGCGIHLHFEIKDKQVTNNPSGSGLYWGYTHSNPDNYGYHDPNNYIEKISIDKYLTYISPDNIAVYWIQNNKKYHVISPDIINTMQNAGIPGWSSSNIYTVSNSYINGPDFISTSSTSNGMYVRLYKGEDVYWVNNGQKKYVSSTACQQANCWADIIDVPQSYLDMFPTNSSVPSPPQNLSISLRYLPF